MVVILSKQLMRILSRKDTFLKIILQKLKMGNVGSESAEPQADIIETEQAGRTVPKSSKKSKTKFHTRLVDSGDYVLVRMPNKS